LSLFPPGDGIALLLNADILVLHASAFVCVGNSQPRLDSRPPSSAPVPISDFFRCTGHQGRSSLFQAAWYCSYNCGGQLEVASNFNRVYKMLFRIRGNNLLSNFATCVSCTDNHQLREFHVECRMHKRLVGWLVVLVCWFVWRWKGGWMHGQVVVLLAWCRWGELVGWLVSFRSEQDCLITYRKPLFFRVFASYPNCQPKDHRRQSSSPNNPTSNLINQRAIASKQTSPQPAPTTRQASIRLRVRAS
jgi:hypothetical protein